MVLIENVLRPHGNLPMLIDVVPRHSRIGQLEVIILGGAEVVEALDVLEHLADLRLEVL